MRHRALRRTKIIFTVGPATETEEALEAIIRAGADVCRLNMAHATHEWTRTVVGRIRRASQTCGREIAILMDVKGPEVRTGDVDAPMALETGELFDFRVGPSRSAAGGREVVRSVEVNYPGLVNDIAVGDSVLVDNGLIRLEVLSKDETRIRCRVVIPGRLGSRRHINLPGVKINLPALTEKDHGDILLGIETGVDVFALSFVREPADIDALRTFLKANGSGAAIVAKIEDQQAITNLLGIIKTCDLLMIARGDLGIECPFEELPIIQRRAVKTCLNYGRPVIIATHMLESMIGAPIPTRAEVSDVANAVFEQADCIMLSGETAIGTYPVACVEAFDKIARRIERSGGAGYARKIQPGDDKKELWRSAVLMANHIGATGLLAFTRKGQTAHGLAALRPDQTPIFAFTDNRATLRELRLHWGVEPIFMDFEAGPDLTIQKAIAELSRQAYTARGDKVVVVSDILAADRLFDSIQLRTVD